MLWVSQKNSLNETVLLSPQNICLKVSLRGKQIFTIFGFYTLYVQTANALVVKIGAQKKCEEAITCS